MSNIFKPFIAIFKFIYNIIDKLIVTPISRIIYRTNELSRANSGRLEKLLNRPNILVYVSLFCAIIIFLVIDNKVMTLVAQEAQVITGLPIEVIYNEEAYVVEGIPETVDLTLIGRRSDLFLATQLDEHRVELDLRELEVGTHRVRLRYNRNIRTVNYNLSPNIVLVRISERKSDNRPLTYDLLNLNLLDSKLSISSVTLDRNEVTVKGSAEALEQVASVRALIDVQAAELTERGTFTANSIVLAAYDSSGNRLTNVEMVPTKVSATIVVDSYRVDLPVRVVTQGDLTVGKSIATATPIVTTVTVYGDQEVLDELKFIEAIINVEGLSDNRDFNVSLRRPAGVRFMSETTTSVSVTIGPETTREFADIQIHWSNLGTNYSAGAVGEDDQKVSVIASGVASVIEEIASTNGANIRATVDLSGLSVGVHEVPIIVQIDDSRVKLTPRVATARVRITQRN